jgi:hypothetical protein
MRNDLKKELILILMLILIAIVAGSSKNVTPDYIAAMEFKNKGDALLNLSKYNESIDAYNKALN